MAYVWDFGDGMTSTEMNPTHVFEEDGIYIVVLCVTDDDDLTSCCNTDPEGTVRSETITWSDLKMLYD